MFPWHTGTKRRAQQLHAIRRARRYLGVEWNKADLNRIKNHVQRGETRLLERQSSRVTIHEVTDGGQTFIAAYDKVRKTIITVMPWWRWRRVQEFRARRGASA